VVPAQKATGTRYKVKTSRLLSTSKISAEQNNVFIAVQNDETANFRLEFTGNY